MAPVTADKEKGEGKKEPTEAQIKKAVERALLEYGDDLEEMGRGGE